MNPANNCRTAKSNLCSITATTSTTTSATTMVMIWNDIEPYGCGAIISKIFCICPFLSFHIQFILFWRDFLAYHNQSNLFKNAVNECVRCKCKSSKSNHRQQKTPHFKQDWWQMILWRHCYTGYTNNVTLYGGLEVRDFVTTLL